MVLIASLQHLEAGSHERKFSGTGCQGEGVDTLGLGCPSGSKHPNGICGLPKVWAIDLGSLKSGFECLGIILGSPYPGKLPCGLVWAINTEILLEPTSAQIHSVWQMRSYGLERG